MLSTKPPFVMLLSFYTYCEQSLWHFSAFLIYHKTYTNTICAMFCRVSVISEYSNIGNICQYTPFLHIYTTLFQMIQIPQLIGTADGLNFRSNFSENSYFITTMGSNTLRMESYHRHWTVWNCIQIMYCRLPPPKCLLSLLYRILLEYGRPIFMWQN